MIRWRRVLFIALVAGGIVATAILTPVAYFAYRAAARAVVHPIPATDVEQRDILRVLLETQEYSGVPPPPPGYGGGEPAPKKISSSSSTGPSRSAPARKPSRQAMTGARRGRVRSTRRRSTRTFPNGSCAS